MKIRSNGFQGSRDYADLSESIELDLSESVGYTDAEVNEILRCSEDPAHFINTYCLPLTAESFLSIPQSRVTARSCMFLTRVQSATPSSRQPRPLMA